MESLINILIFYVNVHASQYSKFCVNLKFEANLNWFQIKILMLLPLLTFVSAVNVIKNNYNYLNLDEYMMSSWTVFMSYIINKNINLKVNFNFNSIYICFKFKTSNFWTKMSFKIAWKYQIHFQAGFFFCIPYVFKHFCLTFESWDKVTFKNSKTSFLLL